MVGVVEGVYVGFLGGSLNLNFGAGGGINFLSEGFEVGRVFGVELFEGFFGDGFDSGELVNGSS